MVSTLLAILVCEPVWQFSSVSGVIALMFSDFASELEVEVESLGFIDTLTFILSPSTFDLVEDLTQVT